MRLVTIWLHNIQKLITHDFFCNEGKPKFHIYDVWGLAKRENKVVEI